jgi:hypothetical protein
MVKNTSIEHDFLGSYFMEDLDIDKQISIENSLFIRKSWKLILACFSMATIIKPANAIQRGNMKDMMLDPTLRNSYVKSKINSSISKAPNEALNLLVIQNALFEKYQEWFEGEKIQFKLDLQNSLNNTTSQYLLSLEQSRNNDGWSRLHNSKLFSLEKNRLKAQLVNDARFQMIQKNLIDEVVKNQIKNYLNPLFYGCSITLGVALSTVLIYYFFLPRINSKQKRDEILFKLRGGLWLDEILKNRFRDKVDRQKNLKLAFSNTPSFVIVAFIIFIADLLGEMDKIPKVLQEIFGIKKRSLFKNFQKGFYCFCNSIYLYLFLIVLAGIIFHCLKHHRLQYLKKKRKAKIIYYPYRLS